MVGCLHLPPLTRRRGGSYVRGEKTGMDTRSDRSPPAHSRHNALTGSEQAGGDYACTDNGDSQRLEIRLPTRQPEKCVEKRCAFYTSFNTRNRTNRKKLVDFRRPRSRSRSKDRSLVALDSSYSKNRGVPPAPHHSTGRAVARLQLLILILPPLRQAEWRRSSGGQARSGVRRSRTHREEVVAKPTGGNPPR
jgi:hypothetical protein